VVRVDRQGPELVEGETPPGVVGDDFLDAVELGVLVRVGRPPPGAGALEGDVVFAEQPSQPFPADGHGPDGVVGKIAGEFADAPVGERRPSFLGRVRAVVMR
jgi:hypothetical protein